MREGLIRRWIVILALTVVGNSYSLAQKIEDQIVIRVADLASATSNPAASFAGYLNGYRSAISGQIIEYHSSDPDADSALIVRAQTIAHSISWQTDPTPANSDEFVQFIWLAGIECQGFAQEKDTHQFDFLINGRVWFTFRNAKDATAKLWKVDGKDGAQLSFTSLLTDTVGDLFGYMVLKLPRADFETGKPLMFQVTGDNSGSADWYMTFQHPFEFVPHVRAEPALLRDGARASQLLRVSVDNLNEGRALEVRVPNHESIRIPLKIGSNIVNVPIPAANSQANWLVRFEFNNRLVETSTIQVSPVKKRDIYLLSYSHNDIGYTDLQPDVERKQWANLDQAMQLIRETKDYPPDARYKWNL